MAQVKGGTKRKTKSDEKIKSRAAEARAYQVETSRGYQLLASEIGEPPITAKQRRRGRDLRKRCERDLLAFNVRAFPNSTGLKPLGQIQIDSIAHDQSVILTGGKVCKAEPRGFGKTTRTTNAALWAALYGHRKMVPVFSSSLAKSRTIMDRWKQELNGNDLLFWMFPDLIWPLRALENRYQRSATQTFRGELTQTSWTSDRIVLPTIAGERGSGSILLGLPLKSCRGATHTNSEGEVQRPELVLLDDVQRDEDASNPNTVAKLDDLIEHGAMLLGGHSKSIASVMSCTVRQSRDLSERYLSKPGWRRVRYKMLVSRATLEEKHWFGKYKDIRHSFDPESSDDCERAKRDSLKYYRKNRRAMDDGAVASWKWAFAWADEEPTEISAIQHAYNIIIDSGESVFACECQNEPLREKHAIDLLTVEEIMGKQSHTPRGIVPKGHSVVTAMIDVHPEILDYEVWSWADRFGGCKIAGGTYPDQRRSLFVHTDPPIPLSKKHAGSDPARIVAGLEQLFEDILGREWMGEDGTPQHVALLLVDGNGKESDAIKLAAKRSKYAARIMVSFGMGITARRKPISQWTEKIETRSAGPEWTKTKRKPREKQGIVFDANYWKTRFHSQLALPIAEPGSLCVYKTTRNTQQAHVRSAEGYRAERPIEVKAVATGRTVQEWQAIPGRENHPLDCAVGCMVGASVSGVTTGDLPKAKRSRKRRKRITYQ